MAKRYFSTDLFHEDWFVDLHPDNKLFFIYALLNCDHAGFLRVNLKVFNALNGTSADPDTVLKEINAEKQRFRKLTERLWFIEDFISFQYGRVLNPKNKVHKSVLELLEKNGVKVGSIKGLDKPLEGVKDKEKDKVKEKDNNRESRKGGSIELKELEEIFLSCLTFLGLPENAFGDYKELALSYYTHYGSQGWRKNNKMLITDHRLNITKWLMSEKSKNASKPSNNQNTKRSWD